MGSDQQAPPPYPGHGQAALHQPSTPLFVSPPAKSQRLLHSEAYLRYIEGLTAESSTVSKWDQALTGSFFYYMVIKSAKNGNDSMVKQFFCPP